MPRRRPDDEQPAELNLLPFMNMVVLLIPILLLSVIFVSVGVVNVSTDVSAPSLETAPPKEEPLKLTVALSRDGFEVITAKRHLPPVDGCAQDGPTICLADPSVDVDAHFERARRLFDQGDAAEAEAALDEAMAAYDFRRLYNRLSAIKRDHPEETRIIMTGEADMPYAMLIRAMDVARFKLDKDRYAKASQFWAANEQIAAGKTTPLFSDPVLAIAQ